MTAWEAITVAAVARTVIGSCAQPGASRKNGAFTTLVPEQVRPARTQLSTSAGTPEPAIPG